MVFIVTGSKTALIRLVTRGLGVALMPTIGIEATWRTGLGAAERPLHALLDIARRQSPVPTLVS